MYRMLKKHEIILEDAIRQLIKIIIRLGRILNYPLNENTEITVDFDDSIIEDKEAEIQKDFQMLSVGILKPEEFRSKWLGETLETAKKNLPKVEEVIE